MSFVTPSLAPRLGSSFMIRIGIGKLADFDNEAKRWMKTAYDMDQ